MFKHEFHAGATVAMVSLLFISGCSANSSNVAESAGDGEESSFGLESSAKPAETSNDQSTISSTKKGGQTVSPAAELQAPDLSFVKSLRPSANPTPSGVKVGSIPSNYEECTQSTFAKNLKVAKAVVAEIRAGDVENVARKIGSVSPCLEKVDVNGDGVQSTLHEEVIGAGNVERAIQAIKAAKQEEFDLSFALFEGMAISENTIGNMPVLDLNGDGVKNKAWIEALQGIEIYLAYHGILGAKGADGLESFGRASGFIESIGSVEFAQSSSSFDVNGDGDAESLALEGKSGFNFYAAKFVVNAISQGDRSAAKEVYGMMYVGVGRAQDINGDGQSTTPDQEAKKALDGG